MLKAHPPFFKNKVVILTGATGTLGRVLAFQLSKLGARLTLAARQINRLEEVANTCRKLGAEVFLVQTDVSNEQQCKNLIDMTIEKYGQIDMLINNAAFVAKKKFEEMSNLEDFKSTIDTNFWGAVYCTFYALPFLRKTKGRIVGIGSILGKVATPGNTAYCGSKFAMTGFYNSLSHELSDSGVSTTMVYPGYLKEKMMSKDTNENVNRNQLFSWLFLSTDVCARKILEAAASRKRQIILPFYCVIIVMFEAIMPRVFDCIINFKSKYNG